MKIQRTKKIGVFDSGFGGLDILRGIIQENGEYDYLYLGDTARTPYGTRSQEIIYEFTKQAIDFLFAKNCELIIIACNTASAEALRKIQKNYIPKKYPHKKVLGVLIPAVESALEKTINKKVGIIATASTVRSCAFTKEIHKRDTSIRVYEQACPLLVPIVEAGEKYHKATDIILREYLQPLQKKHIDTLILGCTHYGLLESKIKKILGKDVAIISEARTVPKKLKLYLHNHSSLEQTLSKKSSLLFYSTDLTENFQTLGSMFFGKKINVKKITLQ